jgi:hypothetical protein
VLSAPGQPYVLALEPEFIVPQDGYDKQDCEQQAIYLQYWDAMIDFMAKELEVEPT